MTTYLKYEMLRYLLFYVAYETYIIFLIEGIPFQRILWLLWDSILLLRKRPLFILES